MLEPQNTAWVGRSIHVVHPDLCWLRYNESRSAVRAWSLTAISIFSLVPILAFGFSISKGFGLYENLQSDVVEPLLVNWLELEQLPELSNAFSELMTFIDATDLSSLGLVGFVTVAYSVIRLMSAVEESLNDIWGAPSARSFVRKVSDYLSVSMIIPVLLLVAATGSAAFHLDEAILTMESWGDLGTYMIRFGILMIVWLGFGLIYLVMPNISIKPTAAFYGGVVGGSLWLFVHQAHVSLCRCANTMPHAGLPVFSHLYDLGLRVMGFVLGLCSLCPAESRRASAKSHTFDLVFLHRERLCLDLLVSVVATTEMICSLPKRSSLKLGHLTRRNRRGYSRFGAVRTCRGHPQ